MDSILGLSFYRVSVMPRWDSSLIRASQGFVHYNILVLLPGCFDTLGAYFARQEFKDKCF